MGYELNDNFLSCCSNCTLFPRQLDCIALHNHVAVILDSSEEMISSAISYFREKMLFGGVKGGKFNERRRQHEGRIISLF